MNDQIWTPLHGIAGERRYTVKTSLCLAWLIIFVVCLCSAGCTSPPVKKEVRGDDFEAGEIVQSDFNRIANLTMRDNLDSLALLLDKLYKRNPVEWKKTSLPSREAAHERIMKAIRENQPLPEFGEGVISVAALHLAFDPAFKGDRAGLLIYGLGTMLMELYGGHLTLYIINGLNAQEVANAAFNFEVAAWLLASRKDEHGKALLLSNEISVAGRNLSFEREFGAILGRLQLLAALNDEKYRRIMINYVQGLLSAPLIQFLPLDAVTAVAQ